MDHEAPQEQVCGVVSGAVKRGMCCCMALDAGRLLVERGMHMLVAMLMSAISLCHPVQAVLNCDSNWG